MNRATPSTGWARNPDGTLGYTWNPITGCLNHVNGMCKGGGFPCFAYKLAWGRVKHIYLENHHWTPVVCEHSKAALFDPFYPRFWQEKLSDGILELQRAKTPRGIFVCDMSDLFGIGVPEEWTKSVLWAIGNLPQHRFYLLTKQPQNLAKWSPFPPNAWVGVTGTGQAAIENALPHLGAVQATVKFLSIEPLLSETYAYTWRDVLRQYGVTWVIIGSQTKPYRPPKLVWVQEIVQACDRAGVKVFLKDNLKPLLFDSFSDRILVPEWARGYGEYDGIGGFVLRQELPE